MNTVDHFEITIPGIPPSVNEYKKPHWGRRKFYITPEASRFKRAVGYLARGQVVIGERFKMEVRIYLGKAQRLDADNSVKVIADSLQESGVFGGKSDAAVKELHIFIDRDAGNPRTCVKVEAM